MTVKIELIKAELERLIIDILKFINSISEEPVSKGLEEAANNYANEHKINYKSWEVKSVDVEEAFKAGARWQKQQTIDKTISWLEYHVHKDEIGEYKEYMKEECV